jgi:hypothetical protein
MREKLKSTQYIDTIILRQVDGILIVQLYACFFLIWTPWIPQTAINTEETIIRTCNFTLIYLIKKIVLDLAFPARSCYDHTKCHKDINNDHSSSEILRKNIFYMYNKLNYTIISTKGFAFYFIYIVFSMYT